ncbi:MAG: glycosyltransferase family 4 protein [Caldilineaceae bacterium]
MSVKVRPGALKNSPSNGKGKAARAVQPKKQLAKRSKAPLKVAYIMSRFPKITETFVLYEMLAMEQQGVQIELYPLQRERTKVMHPEAGPFVERAHFQPHLSLAILLTQFYFLFKQPLTYLGALWTLIRANWGSLRYLGGALAFFPKSAHIARLMAADGIEHIHAHFASHPAAAAFIIHRLVGIPYSFTAHGSDIHRDRHMLREKIAESAFAVPISEYNKEIMLAECHGQYREKVLVIHCGVDTQMFQPRTAPTPHELGQGPFMILCIGTLHEVKGQTYLIDACRLLQERGVDFACHFVADGPDLTKLTQQTEAAGLKDRVHFHGRVTHEAIVNLLKQADVMATPSVPSSDGRREGIPVVLMEGMGSSAPVVASAISGIPELVADGQCGFLVPPRDVQGLADALEKLYKDPALRRRFGQAGREKVLKEFDLNTNAGILARHFAGRK